tara:strand:+ start:475 stop:660 length:186 start_codon:yes stop_codon:yes gene_type:complete
MNKTEAFTKRTELLKQYRVIATRKGRKGDLILARKNVGGACEVVKLSANNRFVVSDILEKR